MVQALCGFTSEARWLRHARARLRSLFPYLPQQPGYNKRLRGCAGLVLHVIRALARPARKGEPDRPGARLVKPLRQTVESINETFKGQLDLERHGGHTPAGVLVRVLQRILALTAAIWHNDRTGQPSKRSLIAYDH